VLFLLLAIAQLATRRRGRATVALLFTLATIASIAAPLLVRRPAVRDEASADREAALPPQPQTAGPRIVLIGFDGASLDVISPAVAAGRLPNFGRLLDRGASMHMATTRPTQPEPAWASVVTGKWPAQHGIRAAATYRAFNSGIVLEVLPDYLFSQALVRFGLLVEEPHTSKSLSAHPIWRLLDRHGVPSGIIGLPLTHPAESTLGFMISDRFHRRGDRQLELGFAQTMRPSAAAPFAAAALSDDEEQSPALRAGLDLVPQTAESASLLEADRIHHRLAARLSEFQDVRLLAVRYPGLDAVGHYYMRYARPEAFGDVSDDERRIYGRVLDDYYSYADSLVGGALAALEGDDVLIVVSAFGMEPLTVGKRLLERVVGDERFTGTHERAPDGFLMAFGAPVASGRFPRGAVVDVVPTLLYALGLPVARDMDGSARTDIFTPAFNSERTITFIPTYEP
jgi:predicted AlkP superfamily pyrophosphatase or phosphodiesterase